MRVERTQREKGTVAVDLLIALFLAVIIFTLGWLSLCFILWVWIPPLSAPGLRIWALISLGCAGYLWWRAP